MPGPRKYDQETRDRAVRMYQDQRREKPAESAIEARRRAGELLDLLHPRLTQRASGGDPRGAALCPERTRTWAPS